MNLLPSETRLEGQWVTVAGGVISDETANRVEWLINHRLVKRASDSSGWDTLYEDPIDGRLWELTYPHSEMHGGGPPTLSLISTEQAQQKYRV